MQERTTAERLHEYKAVTAEIEDCISDAFKKYEPEVYNDLEFTIGSDWYDNSLEIHIENSLPYPYEPCIEIRKVVFDLGFSNVYWNFINDKMDVICDRLIGSPPTLIKDSADEVRNYEPRHNRNAHWESTKYGYVDERFNEKEWVEKYMKK